MEAGSERRFAVVTGASSGIGFELAKPAGVEGLYERIARAGRPVDAVALNADIGAGGAFATETDLDKELALIDLNVRPAVHLCKLVLKETEVSVTALMPEPGSAEVAKS